MEDTCRKVIQCRAAVAWKPNSPLKIEQIEVDPPKAFEVRVKICYAALCHTDYYTLSGEDPEGLFPVILGHESAGIVESIGEGVTSVEPGDHVIPVFVPQCRKCDYCKNSRSNHCSVIRDTQGKGLMPDGTSRFTCNGKKLFHFMGCSSFSQYTVCAEISLVKVNPKASLEKICLLACGVSTGYGAVLKTCNVERGSSVAIWGLGAVGLAAVMGAFSAGAKKIVAIDTNSKKLEIAKKFGATNFENPSEVSKEKSFLQYLLDKYDGGFDYTIECVGNSETMRQAFEAAHKGWGISCIVGVAKAGKEFSTKPFQFITGRTLKGTSLGGWKTRDEIPKLVENCLEEKLQLDNFITHKLDFNNINKSFDFLLSGESLRSVISITN